MKAPQKDNNYGELGPSIAIILIWPKVLRKNIAIAKLSSPCPKFSEAFS
jgi:hypothetical protein